MPFALDSNPNISEVSDAVNYLLANFSANITADPSNGQIVGPGGVVIAYLYKYLSVKYSDSFDGSVNFSNSPTNREYYGLWNNDSSVESTNPADYIWRKVAGGFGTTKFLFYQTSGGRSIDFVVATASPSNYYIQDSGTAIDLDIVTASTPGISASIAYRVQNQADPTPSGFPQYTVGSSLPIGWSASLGAVSVGTVVWYTFGKYNGTDATVDGIPPDTTYWAEPVAASIFQDIRSDNWNGSTPPVAGTPATYGTAGYYIQRDTGNVFLNSVYGRGIANFNGANTAVGGNSAIVGNSSGDQFYGVFGYAGTGGYGIRGYGGTVGSGVYGTGQFSGVSGSTTSGSGYGGEFDNNFGGNAVKISFGTLAISNSTLVTNLNADYLDGQHGSYYLSTTGTAADSNSLGGFSASSWARIFATNSGTANAGGSGINLLGSTSTGIAGAYVGTSGSGNIVTWTIQTTSPSDVRLKEEIQNADLGLEFVNKLRPVSYKLIADPKHQKGYGFVADEVEDLIGLDSSLVYFEPDWQVGDEKGFKTIHYPSYIAILTKAVQELSAEVAALKAKG